VALGRPAHGTFGFAAGVTDRGRGGKGPSMKAFLDIDTQIDFLFPAGALYAAGAERVIEPVARLNRFAVEKSIPLISSMCAHAEDAEEFQSWPPHCIVDTFGQRKPAVTLMEKRVVVPNTPAELNIEGAEQIVVEKDDLDLFSNPNIGALLDKIGADEFYVYGVFTEHCVNCAASGLVKRGAKVFLVSDAITAVDDAKGRETAERLLGAGATMVTSDEVMRAA
jgi:nicotinamidase/pyrazinamidase